MRQRQKRWRFSQHYFGPPAFYSTLLFISTIQLKLASVQSLTLQSTPLQPSYFFPPASGISILIWLSVECCPSVRMLRSRPNMNPIIMQHHREVQLKGTSVAFSSSSMTLSKLRQASPRSTLLMLQWSQCSPLLSSCSNSSWQVWMTQEATLVLRWWMWWYSMPLLKGRRRGGMQRKVLPSRAAFAKFHFCCRSRQGSFTECCRWNSIVPMAWAMCTLQYMGQKGRPTRSNPHVNSTTLSSFQSTDELKTPYLLTQLYRMPKNQTNWTVNVKNITGSLKIRTSNLSGIFISWYCFLVKRMVCERSVRSRLPKCLWWWLWPSLQLLKGKWTQMPMALPTSLFIAIEEKNEKWAMSWNWMNRRTMLSVWTAHPTNPRSYWISKQASTSISTDTPIAVHALKSFGLIQLLIKRVTSSGFTDSAIPIFL